jgi:transaldolase
MHLFLDTADIEMVKTIPSVCVQGITTNPTHLSKVPQSPLSVIAQLHEQVPHATIHVEITETDPEKAYLQAQKIRALGPHIVVKVPCIVSFFPLIAQLVKEQIPVNVTLVFSVTQALLMAQLGVTYVSPFVGRLYDHKEDGIAILQSIVDAFVCYGYKTWVLAASLRTYEHVLQAVRAGADIITIPPVLFSSLATHPLTESGVQQFAQDWQKKNNEGCC